MATIKDIAKKAGVAQGTVSNVLNGKGNVSSDKIRRVMEAARQLGYVPNERAALLRKGTNDCLALIMPDSRARQYEDFYFSFKDYAQEHGYLVSRHLTNENSPESEATAFSEAKVKQVKGIACISAVAGTASEAAIYKNNGIFGEMEPAQNNGSDIPVLFVDRKTGFPSDFIGFDYEKAGQAMAEKALQAGYRSICLLTGNPDYSSEKDFCRGFLTMMEGSTCQVIQIWTDSFRKYQNIMQIFNGTLPQAFFISNYGFAESAKDMCTTFYGKEEGSPDIYTVAPLFTIPENDFIKYEMNYRQLGKRAAKMLIRKAEESGAEESTAQESATEENTASEKIPDNVGTEGHANWMIPGDGFQNWFVNIRKPESTQPLNIVTLDSPEAYIMKMFSRLFTQKTGIDVNVCILSYDEIYEAFNSLDETSRFDILRLDVTWLSWFAQKLLRPLSEIDENIENSLGQYVEGVPEHYCRVHGQIYALPVTPSVQILYYRKDLFESPICKRTYFEQFHEELQPPKTFEEYNRIAAFFTRDLTPSSPVPYGSTITLGSTGVAGSEFLARLFAIQENLYGADGQIHLDSLQCQKALAELVQLRRCTSPEYCGWWTQTARRFAEGNFAMSILYSNYASDLSAHSSHVVGNVGYSMMPGNNPVLGGGSLGVSKYCKRPKDALSFIKWMCSEPLCSASALLGSTSPCRRTYDNYEVLHNYPWLKLTRHCFPISKGNRLPAELSVPFDERKFLSILGLAVKNAYTGIVTPKEALSDAQMQFSNYFHTSLEKR